MWVLNAAKYARVPVLLQRRYSIADDLYRVRSRAANGLADPLQNGLDVRGEGRNVFVNARRCRAARCHIAQMVPSGFKEGYNANNVAVSRSFAVGAK